MYLERVLCSFRIYYYIIEEKQVQRCVVICLRLYSELGVQGLDLDFLFGLDFLV